MSLAPLYWHATLEIGTIFNTSANRNTTVNKAKFVVCLSMAVSMLIIQVGGVLAAPAIQLAPPIQGTVQSISIENDTVTGVKAVVITLLDGDLLLHTLRLSEQTAKEVGLVMFDSDGKLVINHLALGKTVEIASEAIIPAQEKNRHPLGDALATFFSDIEGLDYKAVMAAHRQGNGFGVIAQALWLTARMDGNVDIFRALILAKSNGDYTSFVLNDGTTPKNWAELRKAVLDGTTNANLGSLISDQDNEGGEANREKEKDNNKDKEKDKNKDKENQGDNGNNEEKEKKK
jgi:hypothetical protein